MKTQPSLPYVKLNNSYCSLIDFGKLFYQLIYKYSFDFPYVVTSYEINILAKSEETHDRSFAIMDLFIKNLFKMLEQFYVRQFEDEFYQQEFLNISETIAEQSRWTDSKGIPEATLRKMLYA